MRFNFTFLVVFFVAAVAWSDTPNPQVILGPNARSLKVGPGMNARGLELEGTKIVGKDLTGATFEHSDLRGAWLEDCELQGASFREADLRGARMMDCRIENADFTNAFINDIIPAQGLPLKGRHDLDFSESQMKSTASYKQKNLSHCPLEHLSNLDLSHFDLRGSAVTCSEDTRLRGALICDARISVIGPLAAEELRKTRDFVSGIVKCDLRFYGAADLSGICIHDSELMIHPGERDEIANFDFSGAVIHNCRIWLVSSSGKKLLPTTRSFKEGHFLYNRLWRTKDMSDMDLSQMNLMGCDFGRADVTGTLFENAMIDLVNFQDAQGLTEQQIKSTWNYRNNRMRWVTLPAHLKHLKEESAEE